VPEWCEGAEMKSEVDGTVAAAEVDKGYLVIAGLAAGARGEVTFPVACKVEKEIVDGTAYTTTWIGNQIVDIAPRGVVSPLPF